MTNVFIDDYVNAERYEVTLSQNTFNKVEQNWYSKDSLLVNLNHTEMFKDRHTWNDLKPIHYNLMILQNFVHLDKIKSFQRIDATHPAVQSLHFLIAALAKCLMMYSDSKLLMLKITRINTKLINFDYTSTLWLETYLKSHECELKIVVDNTKAE